MPVSEMQLWMLDTVSEEASRDFARWDDAADSPLRPARRGSALAVLAVSCRHLERQLQLQLQLQLITSFLKFAHGVLAVDHMGLPTDLLHHIWQFFLPALPLAGRGRSSAELQLVCKQAARRARAPRHTTASCSSALALSVRLLADVWTCPRLRDLVSMPPAEKARTAKARACDWDLKGLSLRTRADSRKDRARLQQAVWQRAPDVNHVICDSGGELLGALLRSVGGCVFKAGKALHRWAADGAFRCTLHAVAFD